MERNVEIISEELIKPVPSSHPESYKLSARDVLIPPYSFPLLLYYPASDQYSISQQLKTSLSTILADFYPFAGRINVGDNSIRCKDEGVLFIEAFAHGYTLQDIRSHGRKILRQLLPPKFEEGGKLTTLLLRIQLTFCECGGIIVGCWISHTLCDATSICTLINSWAATNRGAASNSLLAPDFRTGIQVFPPTNNNTAAASLVLPQPVDEKTIVTKIFSFDPSSLSKLKSKALSEDVPTPTRVEAVTALIWKCVTASAATGKSYLSHAVNYRKKLVPPLSSQTIGNIGGAYFTGKDDSEKQDLPQLVAILRKCSLELGNLTWDVALDSILDSFRLYEELVSSNDVLLYAFTSWCGIPFYEADFGWGKPEWISFIEYPLDNRIMLLDTNDGGIQAWVCLKVNRMALLEQNPELLNFATIH